jgi:hypothetical protein
VFIAYGHALKDKFKPGQLKKGTDKSGMHTYTHLYVRVLFIDLQRGMHKRRSVSLDGQRRGPNRVVEMRAQKMMRNWRQRRRRRKSWAGERIRCVTKLRVCVCVCVRGMRARRTKQRSR